MLRFAVPGFLVALAAAALLFVCAGPAFANHVRCGDVIAKDTKLDSDLIDCPLSGIAIGADDVTLDLNGHTIDGEASYGSGVYGGGRHGLRIEDGTIQGFLAGVTLETGTIGNQGPFKEYPGGFSYPTSLALGQNVVRGLTVHDNAGFGIDVSGSNDNRIEENRVYSNGWGGISLKGFSSRSSIKRNVVSGNVLGIYFEVLDGQIRGNRVSDNANGGLVGYALTSPVERNIATRNDSTGIELVTHESEVAGNVASGNGWDGIGLGRMGGQATTSSRITRNVAYGNSHDGIAFRYEQQWSDPPGDGPSQNISFEANRASNNGRHGIFAFTSYGNRFERNEVSGNGTTGLTVTFGRRNLVARNSAAGNAVGGIAVIGRNPGTAENLIERNSAVRNGGVGITADGFHNRIEHNSARKNLGDGILIMNMFANWVTANVANANGDDGIELNEEGPSLVTRNSADRNVDLGISAIEGVVDGGGNTASGNGNPLQCFNIACR